MKNIFGFALPSLALAFAFVTLPVSFSAGDGLLPTIEINEACGQEWCCVETGSQCGDDLSWMEGHVECDPPVLD